MRLRTKFGIGLILITLVLSAGVYGGLEQYKQRVVGQATDDVDETARLTANQIDTTVQEKKDFISFIASRPRASRFNESDTYLDGLLRNSRFFAGQIIAANGTVVSFRGQITNEMRRQTIGRDIGDRTYVETALTGESYISPPEYVSSTDHYLVIISAPIFREQDIVGVLAAAIYVDSQSFFTMVGPLETSTHTVRISANDTVLYETGNSFDEEITRSAVVDSTGWVVTVIQDRSGLIVQLRDLAIAQGLGLLVVLLSVIVFGIWEYRTTLNQTEKLLDAFSDLRQGDFTQLSLSAAEEWEQISDGFNELSESLKEREQTLYEREQRLEVLNRVLRHNVRNHTSIMLNYAELIGDISSDPKVMNAAETIRRTSWELTDLSEKATQIENALDSSSGDQKIPIDIVTVLTKIIERTQRSYPHIEFHSRFPEKGFVHAIPAIEIAVENIVENACEYNDNPDPHIKVEVSKKQTDDRSRVQIEIEDNGPGLPEQERTVLTEGRETSLEHGSGLGLWLVYWTVEKSGGDLEFSNNDPVGTIVTITLDGVSENPDEPAN